MNYNEERIENPDFLHIGWQALTAAKSADYILRLQQVQRVIAGQQRA